MCALEREADMGPALRRVSISALGWGVMGEVLEQHGGSFYLGGLERGFSELFLKPVSVRTAEGWSTPRGCGTGQEG